MPTAGTVLSERFFAALRAPGVAEQAGVASDVWASTTTPRVFRGLGGYLAGRNRGRLPFIEFDIESQRFGQDTREGGTLTSRVTVRAHCGGRDPETAGNTLEALLAAGLVAIRNESADNYTALGDDEIGPLTQGPWGHQRDAVVTIEHTFARSDFEVT